MFYLNPLQEKISHIRISVIDYNFQIKQQQTINGLLKYTDIYNNIVYYFFCMPRFKKVSSFRYFAQIKLSELSKK